jgi:hypothetical protein
MIPAVRGLEDFSLATFTPLVGEPFQILAEDGVTVDVVLMEATEPPLDREPTGARVPFSIVFRGPLEPLLPQSIYRLSHEALGQFDLFIVPIGQDEEGTRYEAVFA